MLRSNSITSMHRLSLERDQLNKGHGLVDLYDWVLRCINFTSENISQHIVHLPIWLAHIINEKFFKK